MPNGYTVVPNVIPGTLNIGGDLDVKGEIRVGPFVPRLHLFMSAAQAAFMAYNLKPDTATRDQAGTDINYEIFGPLVSEPQFTIAKGAGASTVMAFKHALFTDYTQHNHTGTVTEDTIYSKVIRGNLLGANGGLRLLLRYQPTVQGGVNSTLRVKLGATNFANIAIAAARAGIDCMLDIVIANRNAANAQVSPLVDAVSGTAPTVQTGAGAVDTTVDQTLAVTIQNGAAADNQGFQLCAVELINTFGPVT